MPVRVTIVYAPGDEGMAASLEECIRSFGYETWHMGHVGVGEQIAAEVSKQLYSGGPVVLCGTCRAVGSSWVRKIIWAVQIPGASNPKRVFPVRMEPEADLEALGFSAKIAECHANFEDGAKELTRSLNERFPVHPHQEKSRSRAESTRDFNNWITNETEYSAHVLTRYRQALRPEVKALLPDLLSDQRFLEAANFSVASRLSSHGVLLFQDLPHHVIAKAFIQCVQYSGTARSDGLDSRDVMGPIVSQIEQSLAFIESHIEKVEFLSADTASAKMDYKYPTACLREVIANALCHRDYADEKRHTNVRLFSDRIEVSSPGKWGARVLEQDMEYSLSDLKSESVSNNGRLADALRWIKLVETQGSGIPNALEDCKDQRAPIPKLVSRDGLIVVTIFPRRDWDNRSIGRRGGFQDAQRSTISAQGDRHSSPPTADPDLDAYRAWALDRYQGLSLIGVGGGEVRMRLDEVYVPLSIAARAEMPELDERHGKGRGERIREMACEDVKLSEIFRADRTESPHAVVFGEPGAGKTTALVKLLYECLESGPESLGLAAGTIPVLLPLRHIGEADLDAPLDAAIQKHLDDTAGGKLASDLGERLWQRGNLLLLLDGLDEIADEGLRARVAKMLEWRLRGEERRGVRAVVSCRYAGYGGPVKLGEGFLHLDVRPLDARQVRSLVQLWFREVQRMLPDYPVAEAQKAAADLCEALEGADFAAQKLKVLVSTPLLLTLMCVVVLRGGEMPRHRVAFYDQCLRVLLGRWGKAQGRRDPLLDADTALALLRPLAWRLHSEQRRDNLSTAELVLHIEQQLEKLSQAPIDPFELIGWLYRDAGVLEEYAQHRYGFAHLGLQEYLAALHVPSQGEELLEPLCTTFGKKWWREVVLLLVGLPGQGMFAPLMRRLLACEGWWEHLDLLRDALSEAAEVDLEPFLELLGGDAAAVRKATVLRLLRGQRDPRLAEHAAALTGSGDRDVAALATQVVAESGGGAEIAATDRQLLLLHDPADAEPASELGSRLTALGLPVFVAGEGWEGHLQRLLDSARGVAVLVGERGPWEQPEVATCLGLFDRRKCPLVPVRLPGDGEAPPLPEELTWVPVIDLSAGLGAVDVSLFERALGVREEPKPVALRAAPAVLAGRPVEGEAFVEPVTGSKLLWIPGGRFEMGGTAYDDEQPIHWVCVSPLWLGETPVTNRQYAIYMKATEAQEPEHWRDRRFSDLDQPVVGVSWHDAQVYCKWLSAESRLAVTLPTEAQWEFAARGTDGREYPWGNEEPDKSRACFGLDFEEGQPATVGSFPAGAGPYGTQDQAGNVWEWCLDTWAEKAYEERASKEVSDPRVEGVSEGSRLLRGGAWDVRAMYLRVAYRLRHQPANRNATIGFRVLVAPPSP